MPKKTKPERQEFSFEISLSVLNHLGRNLYRSFATVLGEAISNAWDADANNVHIYIDRKRNRLFIKDDGMGMSADEFQKQFLTIGYTKRKEGDSSPTKKRPYIGRKGIGKLALLSCADKITVISKRRGSAYVGGLIDNSGLDKAITEALTPEQYPLGQWRLETFRPHTRGHIQGTIIFFEGFKEGIKHSFGFLKKIIALYFRFSLLDSSFKIYIDDELIDHKCLDELAAKTEFLWEINELDDPYIKRLKDKFAPKERRKLQLGGEIKGFIASVEKPRDLKITSTDERVGVDLFVNGRLRERDILKHIPTARLVESYLYGQIHFDGLDDKVDRFTSSRESIVADDPKFKKFLDTLRDRIMSKVLSEWDEWRRNHREEGDPDNMSITPKERKAEELYNAVSDDYALPGDSKKKKRVEGWVDDLSGDAKYNFASYAECFISENLLRKLIKEKSIALTPQAKAAILEMKKREQQNKASGNINIELRQANTNLSYLDLKDLAYLADRPDNQAGNQQNCLPHDAKQYKPIRDALMHTARLTDPAKLKLTTVYDNIRARIRTVLSRK